MIRVLWLVASLCACATYGFIVRPSEQSITEITRQARVLYDEANEDDAKVRRSATLAIVQARVNADVRMLSGQGSGSAATAATLRRAADEAKRFHVEIRSLTPETSAPPALGAVAASDDSLDGEDWTLGVRADFHDVVAFLADLPRHDVLIDVHDVDLKSPSAGESSAPVLDGTVHVTVLRLHSNLAEDGYAAISAR